VQVDRLTADPTPANVCRLEMLVHAQALIQDVFTRDLPNDERERLIRGKAEKWRAEPRRLSETS